MMNQQNPLAIYFFGGLLLTSLILVGFIFYPYINVFIVSLVLAIMFRPMYRRLRDWLGGNSSLSAIISTLIAFAVLLGPVAFVGTQIFNEARDLYISLARGGDIFNNFGIRNLEANIRSIAPHLDVDLQTYAKQVVGWIVQNAGATISTATNLVFATFLSVIVLYYLFKEGHRFRGLILRFSPLPNHYDEEIINKLNQTVNSIIRGSLVVALIQGTLTGVGFAIFGVPNPVLWGSIAAVAALLPGVGTSLVAIPAIIFLFVSGSTPQAIGLLIWAGTAVGLIDNLLGPKLIGARARIHPVLILISVLGGLRLFGPVGFLAGPLAVSFLLALLHIYGQWTRHLSQQRQL